MICDGTNVCRERSEIGRRGLNSGQFGRVRVGGVEDLGGGLVVECGFLGAMARFFRWEGWDGWWVSKCLGERKKKRIRYSELCVFVISLLIVISWSRLRWPKKGGRACCRDDFLRLSQPQPPFIVYVFLEHPQLCQYKIKWNKAFTSWRLLDREVLVVEAEACPSQPPHSWSPPQHEHPYQPRPGPFVSSWI